MSLDTELLLYTKTIDQLNYAWKNDHRYFQIRNLNHKLSKKYETVQYIMCIPEYYWNKLKGIEISDKLTDSNNKLFRIAEWKKQVKYNKNYLKKDRIVVSHYC
jgi:hypothetical protein